MNLEALQTQIAAQEEIVNTSLDLNAQKKAQKKLTELKAVEASATKVVVDAQYLPDVGEGEKSVEVQKRNGFLFGGGMALGAIIGIAGGPVGMAAGYAIAKAAEIGSRPQYAVVDKDEEDLKNDEIARLEAQLAHLKK